MALTKEIKADRIEVLENGAVQVRTKTTIVEDGKQISASYHRHVILPGQDYSQEEPRVQAVCAATHTPEVVEAYGAMIAAQGV